MLDPSTVHSKQYWCLKANIDYEEVLHVGRKLSERASSLLSTELLLASFFTSLTQLLTLRRVHRPLFSFQSSAIANCLMADNIHLTVLYHTCKLSGVLWALHFHEILGCVIVRWTEEFMTNSSFCAGSEAGFSMMHGDSNLCNHLGAGKIDEDSISGKDKHAVVSTIRAKRHLSWALSLGVQQHTTAESTRPKKPIWPLPRLIRPHIYFL